jgi:hypothetical protein
MKLFIRILILAIVLAGNLHAQVGRGKLTGAELFFDTDPGLGMGTALTLQGNLNDVMRNAIQSATPALTVGIHTINVRMKDSLGNWGPVFKTTLNVESPISVNRIISAALGRVYWDNNVGSAVGLIILNGNAGNAVNTFITATNLATFANEGLHKLNVQLLDPNGSGNYSPSFTTIVSFESAMDSVRALRVDAGRVWFDNNVPAMPNMIAFDGNFNDALETATLALAAPVLGLHTLNVQLCDSTPTHWGPVFTTTINVESPIAYRNINVAWAQMYWDNDTNNAVTLLAFDGNYDNAVETAFANNVQPLSLGLHTLCVRVKDVADNWSAPFKTIINIEDSLFARNINVVQGEVSVDNSPAITVVALNGNFTEALENVQTTILNSGIAIGLHNLHTRLKGTDGNWGPYFTTAILVSPCASTPTPTVSNTLPLSFCFGDSTVLVASGGYNSYQWICNNSIVGSDDTLVVYNSGNYVVVVTDSTTCPGSSLPVVVDAHDAPLTIQSNAQFCEGTVDSLIATSGFVSYVWSNGASTNKIFVSQGGTYTVTVTDNFGCSKSVSINKIQLLQPPAPVITANGPTSFCPGFDVTLTSDVVTNIVWSNGLTTPSITVDSTGYYAVTVTGANGCKTTSAGVQTFEYLNAQASFSHNGLPLCENSTTVLSANSSVTYLWSDGQTSQNIVPLTSGNYTVQVVDTNGCIAVSAASLINPTPATPLVSLSGPIDFCNGGSVTLTSNTATGNLWSNGASTQAITVFQTGTFTDTVYNVFGCKAGSAPVAVNVHPTATINTSGPTTFCFGDSVTLTANPAVGVNYLWSTGATTQSIVVQSTQAISVIVTETGFGCSDTAYSNIVVNPLPTGSIVANGPTTVCYYENVPLTATGSAHTIFKWYLNGSPITYYIWSLYCNCYVPVYVFGTDYSATSTGTYSAQIIDTITGCTSFTNGINTTFILPPKPVITANGGSTICIGANATLTSTPASSYLWSTGQTTQNISAGTQGYYWLTITDANGCTRVSDSTWVSFYPTASISSNIPTTFCADTNINITAHPTGTYIWSDGSTNATISNINASGIYTVTVTDANGCTSSTSVTITVNPLPFGSISPAGQTTVCFGNAVILNTSGAPNTIYKWFKDGLPISYYLNPYTYYVYGYSYAANATGIYAAQIIDTLTGCTSMTNDISVSVLSLPMASINQTAFNVCNGGNTAALLATASGTIAPYTYLWSNASTNQNINNLYAGNYIVSVTDANGCQNADTFYVAEPGVVVVSASSPANTRGYNISCTGASDGIAYANVSGGTAPYTYLWNTGSTSASINGLPAGTYTVTVTDSENCTPVTAIVTLVQPAPVTISLSPTVFYGGSNISCFGGSDGSVTANPSGGTANFTYVWSNGQITQTAVNLIAGTYTVTATDSVGCSNTANIALTHPAALAGNALISSYMGYNVSCNGVNDGEINYSVNGGTMPYHFSWADSVYSPNRNQLFAGTYYITITDTLGCSINDSIVITQPTQITDSIIGSTLNCYGDSNGTAAVFALGGDAPYTYMWSNSQTTSTASGLTANYYQVTISDVRGCTRVSQVQVEQPAELIGYSFGTYIGCGTQIGLLSATATGGTEPYTYLWSNGSTLEFQTNLPPGNYSVTVTDAHGCFDTSLAVIIDPPVVYATTASDTVQCQNSTDGALTCMASGGVPPYMYLWSNGQTTATIQNLGIGNYTVIVTDANGCTAVNTPSVIAAVNIVNSFQVDNGCVGTNNGVVTVSITGGVMPYSLIWSTGSTNTSIANLSAGTYTLTVTESTGCFVTDSVVVLNNSIAITAVDIKIRRPCFGENNGRLSVNSISGGVGPYTYLWSTGDTTIQIVGLYQGTYTLTVTDANGCKFTQVTTTHQRSIIRVNPKVKNATCNACNGSIKVNVRGGAKPYTYHWLTIPGATTNHVKNLCKGVYELVVIDSLNCKQKFFITVLDGAPIASVNYTDNVNCFSGNDGAIGINVTGWPSAI